MKGERLKVLFWPGWWYPNRRDPIDGIFIKKHAEAVSRFCDVSVLYICSNPALKDRIYELEYLEENGIPTMRIYIKPPPNIPLIRKFIDVLRYVKAGRRGLQFLKEKHGRPDIVHVHVNPPAGLVFLLFTRLRGIPFIHTEHWTGYLETSGKYRGVFRTWLTRRFIKRAKAVTPVSKDLRRAMEKHKLRSRYQIIPNVVDTDLFCIDAGEKRGADGKKRILHVSGLRPVKNVKGLLTALKRLSETRDDFELYIVGDGPDREALEKAAQDLGLRDTFVFFTGRKSVEEVARYMKGAHFFVLFSDFENSPCVIDEAMACGLPIITTDVGGIAEHVNSSNGILIKARDNQALYDAINHMLDNYDQYDQEKIRKYAVSHFSYPVIGETFYQLYREVL
jgi:glycosyltransferase involved in cell wall biosynthesis